MKLLHTLGHVPILGSGFRWMESEMQNNLVKHSVFAALAYLFVSQTDFMISLDRYVSVPNYLVSLFHAVVFGIVMYVSSMFLFTPFLVEGLDGDEKKSSGESDSDTGGTTCPPNYVEAPNEPPQGKCMPDDAEFKRIGAEDYKLLNRELPMTSVDLIKGLRTGFIDQYNSEAPSAEIIKRGLDSGCEKGDLHEMFCRARDGY